MRMLDGIGQTLGWRRLAGRSPSSASATGSVPNGAPPAVVVPARTAAQRQEALIRSNQILSDRLVKSRTALEQVRTTFDDPTVTGMGRGSSMAYAARELGQTLRSVDDLQGQLGHAMGGSSAYRATLGSASGQTLINSTRATARVITPAAETAAAMADLAKAQSQALRDVTDWQRLMGDPTATASTRLAATARATQSASKLVTQQHTTLAALRAADANYLQNPIYGKIERSMADSRAMQAIGRVNGRAVQVAAMTGTAAGAVLGAITLPTAFQGVKTTYENLGKTLADPTATRDQDLGAVADFSRATATSVQGIASLNASMMALSDMTRFSSFLSRTVAQPGSVMAQLGQGVSTTLRILGPVADVGLFVADAVKLRTVFADPSSSGWDRFRSVLALGLDVLKIGSWLMPQTALLRTATLGISTAQLILAASDFARMLGPSVKSWAQTVTDAIQDPGATLRASGQAVVSGALWASAKVVQAADGLSWSVTHSVEAVALAGNRLQQAGDSLGRFFGVLRDSAAVVNGQSPHTELPLPVQTIPPAQPDSLLPVKAPVFEQAPVAAMP